MGIILVLTSLAFYSTEVYESYDRSGGNLTTGNRPTEERNCLLVRTYHGIILGTPIEVPLYDVTHHVTAFYGIPFALNAGGARRFKKPACCAAWKGILNATLKRPPCCQFTQHLPKNFTISGANSTEDCLHLNIWVPSQCADSSHNYTVMFWAHGGGFMAGGNSYSFYDGRFIAAFGDLIVVAPNYRLAAFGFLNMGTTDAPGNMAMHDLLLALRWVRYNIGRFGGNRDNVILVGQSAGAIMMSLLLLSPMLPKFSYVRTYLMSGSAFTPMPKNSGDFAMSKARLLAKMAKCEPRKTSAEMMRCFRAMNSSLLVSLASRGDLYFTPSYGDDILPMEPAELLSRFNIKHREVMMASTYMEGNGFFEIVMSDVVEGKFNLTEESLRKSFPDLLQKAPRGFGDPSLLGMMGYDITKGYQGWADIIGDILFRCATLKYAKHVADRGATVYYREYVPKPSFTLFGGKYATHTDDTLMLFGVPFLFPWHATDEERNTSLRMIRTLSNFAKNG